MKKLLLFVMIILPAALLSQTVSGLKVMPGAAGSASTVTFDVEWTAASLITPWLDSMWVFVDYNKNGKMTRLLISGGTLTEHTATKAGTGEFIPENDMGAWVYGDARYAGSFSAKVELYTKETDIIIAGACAYASSYPPVGKYVSDTKLGFTGTPMYEITLMHTDGSPTVTVEAGSTFLLPCSYTISSFTDKTGAPGILTCVPSTDIYNLTVSATTYCPGSVVTFALDNTTSGRTYQLYKDGVAVMDELTGTGSAKTFTGTFADAGNYAARVKENGTYCAAQMTGTYTVMTYPAVSPGEITTDFTTVAAGATPPNVTIENVTAATGGNITYQWQRTGIKSATLTGSAATYAINNDVINYYTSGTHYFNRYAKDAVCPGVAPVAAAGTYTLYVTSPAPGTVSTTFCEECCWDGDAASTWVNCYVTTLGWPYIPTQLDSGLPWYNTGFSYAYFSGAASDRNGRANTAAIGSANSSAVQVCKNFGTGWYVPAYEELVNMSAGHYNYPPLNGRSGANILQSSSSNGYYWSSTEWYNNGGRYSTSIMIDGSSNDNTRYAVTVVNSGTFNRLYKSSASPVRCVWRP
jgi:hypothetical protein